MYVHRGVEVADGLVWDGKPQPCWLSGQARSVMYDTAGSPLMHIQHQGLFCLELLPSRSLALLHDTGRSCGLQAARLRHVDQIKRQRSDAAGGEMQSYIFITFI